MKKNKLFIIGLVTVFVALLSLTLVSSTFAKYVTTGTGSASARVAKWGFSPATIEFNDLFKESYTNVKSSVEGEKVIAPGTNGTATFAFGHDDTSGAPEVAYTLTVSTEGSSCDASIKNNKNIIWKLDNVACASWDDLLEKIAALAKNGKGTNEYEAGTLPTNFDGNAHTITWEWTFSADAEGDKADTNMGNATTLASVTLKITLTATQID